MVLVVSSTRVRGNKYNSSLTSPVDYGSVLVRVGLASVLSLALLVGRDSH